MGRVALDFNRPWAMNKPQLAELVRGSVQAELEIPETPSPGGPKVVDAPGGIRIIQIEGELFRRDNFYTQYCGATSYDWIYDQVSAAMNDAMVRQILLMINSPGGECDGCFELAEWIREQSAQKPIHAYVQSLAASAAFAIACSAKKITAGPLAYLGSVGVIAFVNDYRKLMSEMGIDEYVFVSSVSPKKNPDPATDPGKAQLQGMVDEMGEIFVAYVSRMRSTSSEHVAQNYGQGAILIASKALAAGMCDTIGNLQSAIEGLRGDAMGQATAVTTTTTTETVTDEEEQMEETPPGEEAPAAAPEEEEEESAKEDKPAPETDKAQAFAAKNPTLAASLMSLGASAERKRLAEIDEVASLYPYHKDLAEHAKYKSSMSAGEFAIACMKASKQAAQTHISKLDEDAKEVPRVQGSTQGGNKEQEIVSRAAKGAQSLDVRARINKGAQ